MDAPAPKRARLSLEDVMVELDSDDDDGPMMLGSDDEFEDIACTEKERDDWGAVNEEYDTAELSPSLSYSTLHSVPCLSATAPGGLTLPSPPSLSVTLPSPPSLSTTAPGGLMLPSQEA